MKHRLKRYTLNIRRFIKTPYWWYQRARYGYADSDAWNGDAFLASNIAGILIWIVESGHGVATSYQDPEEGWYPDVDKMVERRDAEYKKYAAIFSEYAKNGLAYDEEWLIKFGGVLDTDMEDALQWFKEHFYELWD